MGSSLSASLCSFASSIGVESVLACPATLEGVRSALAVPLNSIVCVRGVLGGSEPVDWERRRGSRERLREVWE